MFCPRVATRKPADDAFSGISDELAPPMTDRLDPLLRFHPFTRLNTLLQGIEPGHQRPLLFSVGQAHQSPPEMIKGPLVQNLAEWVRYPLAVRNAEFRRAATDWLNRRFHLPATMLDPDRHLMPIAGT